MLQDEKIAICDGRFEFWERGNSMAEITAPNGFVTQDMHEGWIEQDKGLGRPVLPIPVGRRLCRQIGFVTAVRPKRAPQSVRLTLALG